MINSKSKIFKLLGVVACLFAISACKIRIEVPAGGYVTTESGAITCDSNQRCDVDVLDIYFNETFIAVPNRGKYFNGWAEGDRQLYPGMYVPALIVTTGLAEFPEWIAFIESDETFYLSPTFSSECTHECTVSSLKLLSEDRFGFFTGPKELPFPYSSTANVSATISGIPQPTTYTIDSFILEAEGSDFTIANVRAYDRTNNVRPIFDGIREGTIIRDGQRVEFSLVSPLTQGRTVQLTFSFKILETGDTFTSNISFRSN